MASQDSRPKDTLCKACYEFTDRAFYSTKPVPPGSRALEQSWGRYDSRMFRDVQKNNRCPLCRLICQSLLQNRIPSLPLDHERIYYYRLLYGTYHIAETDEFDPNHEYEDLDLNDLDGYDTKGKDALNALDDNESDDFDEFDPDHEYDELDLNDLDLLDSKAKDAVIGSGSIDSDGFDDLEEYTGPSQSRFGSGDQFSSSINERGKQPEDEVWDSEGDYYEYASDLDSDDIDQLEECTDTEAPNSRATDLVTKGFYKHDYPFRRMNPSKTPPKPVKANRVSKVNYEAVNHEAGNNEKSNDRKGKLPLSQVVRSRIIRRDISQIPRPPGMGDDILKTRHDLGLWKLYQTSRLHVSTNPHVLDRGGPEVARGVDALETRVEDDAEVEICLIGELGCDAKTTLHNAFLHGRRTGSQLDFNLARSWVKTCADTHGSMCSPNELPHDLARRPSRLIDVEKGMIVSTPSTCSYAALSYRWSEGQMMLQKSNYDRLTRLGGLDTHADAIPLTIRDSILLCRQMSTRYLWVDALCIVQDDPIDKQDQICKMDAIYTCAHFTIVAACGADSRAGLPGVRTMSRKPQRMELIHGVTLAVAQPNLAIALARTQWHHRAWTFQEAILSKRLLIFTDFGTYFQCSTALWCEDTHLEKPSFPESDIDQVEVPKFAKPFWKDALPVTRDFWTYAQLVEDYSPREMTSQTDALNAFTGLISSLEITLDTMFFFGLPTIFFHAALCFNFSHRNDNLRRTDFPSWSWCGWDPMDGVDYQDGLFYDEEICFDCHHFFRIRNSPELGRQLIPISLKDSETPSRNVDLYPAISNRFLSNLTARELEYVLIFKAYRGKLYIDIKNDYNESKIYLSPPSVHNAPPIGYVGLPPSMRTGLSRYMDFITMCTEERIPDISVTLLYLVETDQRGVTYRLNITCISTAEWKQVERTFEVVYML